MSKQKKSSSGGLVYSTDPDFRRNEPPPPSDAAPAEGQALRIWLERIKGNKEATVIKGFTGPDARLDELARQLKNKCATGGNAKDGQIILQGDHRDKVLAFLVGLGYKNTKKAGG
jgi:translation initiation factor 1